ncbi:MAG TPA: TonB-dependent receptor [Candidatus Ozemobacteraceae bacterium]|nr:TonB-dependent receptor [Candidatus Ozemobacteraceae bacterium]
MIRNWVVLPMLMLGMAVPAMGADPELEALSLLYEPETVVTATRMPEPAIESPAIMSVFTAQQIQALGVDTLPELLQFVPGFNPWRSIAGDWWPGPRGILDSNRSFMVMIDGVSINNQFLGSPYWTWDLLDLSRFARIEIMRGPGSAVYGANAFLAVINCITDDQGAGTGYLKTTLGSFERRGIAFGRAFRASETLVDLNVSGESSDGQSRYIGADINGRSGLTHDAGTKNDLMLKVTNPHGLTFLAHHVEGDRDGYIGYFNNVNDKTRFRRSNDLLTLKYHRNLNDQAEITGRVFYNRFLDAEIAEAVSPGALFPPTNTVYPLGVMRHDHSRDAVWGADVLFKAAPAGRHRFSIGGERTFIDLAESAVHASSGSPADPTALAFIPGEYPEPGRMNNTSVFAQDDIFLAERLRLVIGARYDDHSAFGSTWNPRAGLIYRLNPRWTGKVLYGKAYRNPDFHEMAGNPGLKSENIRTTEFQLLGEPFHGWFTKMNLFVNQLRDRIQSTDSLVYTNVGRTTFDGLEFETRKRFGGGQEVFGNVSTFRLRELSSPIAIAPDLPHNKLNLGYSFRMREYETCLWGTMTSRRPRNAADSRDALPGLNLVNMTIQKSGFPGPADRIILRVKNLLNAEHSMTPVYIGDGIFDEFPQAGRQISLEMVWDLK